MMEVALGNEPTLPHKKHTPVLSDNKSEKKLYTSRF